MGNLLTTGKNTERAGIRPAAFYENTLVNTEGEIKNWQYRETGNMVHKTNKKQNKNTAQYALDTTMQKQTQIT